MYHPITTSMFVLLLLWCWRAFAWYKSDRAITPIRYFFYRPSAIWGLGCCSTVIPFLLYEMINNYIVGRICDGVFELFFMLACFGLCPKPVTYLEACFYNKHGRLNLHAGLIPGEYFVDPVLEPILYRVGGIDGGKRDQSFYTQFDDAVASIKKKLGGRGGPAAEPEGAG